MKFGLSIPSFGSLATPENIKEISQTAEKLGYSYIGIPDHIVVPRTIGPNYPYSETGKFYWTSNGVTDCMEQFTLLAWIAAVTNTIRVMTSVTVVPHRHPLFMAKALATTDILSGGRVTVGCGAGWMPEEFAALNLPPFEERGHITNEYIEAMKAAWTKRNPSYDGKYVNFLEIDTDPRPIQKPHPPIWIGGESLPAIRRAVALGDVWYPFGSNPKFRMDKLETYSDRVSILRDLALKSGRDPSTIGLAYNCAFHSAEKQTNSDGGRQIFTGEPEQRAEDIKSFEEIGVGTMFVNVSGKDKKTMLFRMQEFADKVMPLTA